MTERHADPIDEAAALTSALTDGAVAAARAASAPEFHPDFDGVSCVDCGNDIPAGRLALKKVRCVECQGAKEKRTSQFARTGWASQSTAFDRPVDQDNAVGGTSA